MRVSIRIMGCTAVIRKRVRRIVGIVLKRSDQADATNHMRIHDRNTYGYKQDEINVIVECVIQLMNLLHFLRLT